jgi:hypothetical protein
MNRITSGRIKKTAGKKCVYNPADLGVTLPKIQEGITKKIAATKYKIPRSTLQYRLSCKLSISSTGPLPVLSEDDNMF